MEIGSKVKEQRNASLGNFSTETVYVSGIPLLLGTQSPQTNV